MAANGDSVHTSEQRVWVITGTSAGLGRALAETALAAGDRVIATARSASKIADLAAAHPDSCRVLELDVTEGIVSLRAKAAEAIGHWGRVDVLVNNGGSGMLGISEEIGSEGYDFVFKTNFFGQLDVTNAFLPHFRERRAGTVVFISSRSAWRAAVPMIGPYAASKAALNAAAETLSLELSPFGIRVLSVLPGSLQTSNLASTVWVPPAPTPLPGGPVKEYLAFSGWMRGYIPGNIGKENGDPKKSADVIVNVVRGVPLPGKEEEWKKTGQWPELNTLILGSDAETNIREKCEGTLKNLDNWKEEIRSIDIKRE